MAEPFLTDAAIMGSSAEGSDIQRQRKLADLLTANAFSQPQGQMISGHYVPPSWTQQLAPLVSGLSGAMLGSNVEKKQEALAKQLRNEEATAIEQYQKIKQNQGTAAANAFLAKQPSALLRQTGLKELLAPPQTKEVNEGGKIFEKDASGQWKEVAAGGQKYHAPISIDTGNSTILLDPVTRQKIAEFPKAHQPVAGQVLETENGPMLINTRTGSAQPIMAGGQPLAGGKPLTESQGNATAFGMRMKESNGLLNNLEDKGVTNTGIARSTIGGIVGMTPFVGEKMQQGVQSGMNLLPGALGGPSAEQQQVDAARKNFITAVLRKESGAAISPSEFYTESQKYFPQPGDSDAVIKQKRHARDTAIKAMEIQAGPGKRQIEQIDTGNTSGWSVKSVK